MSIYPNHNWDVWRFHRVPRDFWDPATLTPQEAKRYADALGEEIDVHTLDDWYRVSLAQLASSGFSMPPQRHGGLIAVLQKAYPDHAWDVAKFEMQSKKASQRVMKNQLSKILAPAHGTVGSIVLSHAFFFEVMLSSLTVSFLLRQRY
jgi:hypothetical protein